MQKLKTKNLFNEIQKYLSQFSKRRIIVNLNCAEEIETRQLPSIVAARVLCFQICWNNLPPSYNQILVLY